MMKNPVQSASLNSTQNYADFFVGNSLTLEVVSQSAQNIDFVNKLSGEIVENFRKW